MPLHAQHEAAVVVLHALDHPVGCPGARSQPLAQAPHGLVVERVDPYPGRPDDVGQERVGQQAHVVGRRVRGRVLAVAQRGVVGQVLVQGAATGDVEHLRPPADREHRHAPGVGRADEGQLEQVKLRLGGAELGRRVLAVVARVQVRAAGEAEPGQAVQQRVGAGRVERRQDDRVAAGVGDGLHVREPEGQLTARGLAARRRRGLAHRAHLRNGHADERGGGHRATVAPGSSAVGGGGSQAPGRLTLAVRTGSPLLPWPCGVAPPCTSQRWEIPAPGICGGRADGFSMARMPDPATSIWVHWRRERAARPRRPPADAPQCATCWGQRMIWEPGPLGMLPVRCDDCLGTGRRMIA